MRNLINFLIKFQSWFVAALLVVLSCMLLFNNNPYHHHVYLTSAGSLTSGIYDATTSFTSYFSLKSINGDLQRQNAMLESEVISLRNYISRLEEAVYADSVAVSQPLAGPNFIIATVVNNSIAKPFNYITIDKGSNDGVRPEMGVVDQNGIIGVVNVVGPHYSRIISLLNPKFRLSCKIKGSDVFGSLVWDGKNPEEAILEELPKHTVYQKGDTIITSGYSAVFPEGLPVGIVLSNDKNADDNFFTLRIKLLADFSQLSAVRLIDNPMLEEIQAIEKEEEEQEK